MGSIKNVVTEPIEGHEDYYMMVRVCLHTNCVESIHQRFTMRMQRQSSFTAANIFSH